MFCLHVFLFFFFFNDTATTEIYTLSLHDALPISSLEGRGPAGEGDLVARGRRAPRLLPSGDLQPVRGRARRPWEPGGLDAPHRGAAHPPQVRAAREGDRSHAHRRRGEPALWHPECSR